MSPWRPREPPGLAVEDPLVREGWIGCPTASPNGSSIPSTRRSPCVSAKVGDYCFKLLGSEPSSRMTLLDFVAQSFARYDQEDISRWVIIEEDRSDEIDLAHPDEAKPAPR